MPFFTSNGTNLYVDVAGSGTSVLFVHDFTLNGRQWALQREALLGTHRVLRLDVRAHGRSASTTRGHRWDQRGEDVQRAMVQVGMQKREAGFLVGHAMSADAVLQAAVAEPRSLKGVVVASPVVWGLESDAWTRTVERMRTLAREGRVEAAIEAYRDDEIFAGVRARADLEDSVRDMQRGFSGDALRSDERSQGPTTFERIADCRVPILVVRPQDDRDDFKLAAREIAARAPRTHVVEIDAAGHFANLEAPDAFNRALLDFFREYE